MTKQELLKIVTVPTQKEIIVAKYFGIVCMCRSKLIITHAIIISEISITALRHMYSTTQ